MRLKLWVLAGFAGIVLTSCESLLDVVSKDAPEEFVTAYLGKEMNDTTWFDYAKGVENARKKARHIAQLYWIPKGNVPKWVDGPENTFFYEGHQYRVLPFSSVKEVDTYVGHNVSFYTFMSALNNPKSRLYTVNLSKEPYHGVGCATYYGTVCSMSVNYALGVDAPFLCRDYPSIGFEDVEPQNVDSIKVCDVVWRTGHTMMIYDLERNKDTGAVESVTIFEVNSIKKYSRDEFLNMWSEGKYTIMRYKYLGGNLTYDPIPYVVNEDESPVNVLFNEVICPDKGDRSCYRTGETVVLDVLDPTYDRVVVTEEKSNKTYEVIVQDGVCSFESLDSGTYIAVAYHGNIESGKACFEVIDTNAAAYKSGKSVVISFSSSNATPLYAILCTETGGKYALKQFSESERLAGVASMVVPDASSCYVKVAFKGKYGIITNSPILIHI